MFLTITRKGMVRQIANLEDSNILNRDDLDAFRVQKNLGGEHFEWLDIDAVGEDEADYPDLNKNKYWKPVKNAN